MQVRPGDVLLGINYGPPPLAPLSQPPQIHLQDVAAALTRARPLAMTFFRCPRLAAHATAPTAQARAAAVTLSAAESRVFAEAAAPAAPSVRGPTTARGDEWGHLRATNGSGTVDAASPQIFSTDVHNEALWGARGAVHDRKPSATHEATETGELFEIEYPSGTSLGLSTDAFEVTYLDGGRPAVLHCCAVRQSRVVQVRPI